MSVIAPIAATNLSAANAFYRAESYNVGINSATRLSLATMRSIAVTFNNAGTLKKVHCMLAIGLADDPANIKSVNCSLRQINATNPTFSNGSQDITLAAHGYSAGQEVVFTTSSTLPTNFAINTTYFIIATGLTTNTFRVSATVGGTAITAGSAGAGTHTLRSTVGSTQTKTGGQLTDGIPANTIQNQASPSGDNWLISFEGTYGTIDTSASKWTIDFWQSGAQSLDWSINTSDASNPAYIAFCDNTVTASSVTLANPTISIASPAVVTFTAHGLSAGQMIYFTTTGALPTGITANTTYYIIAAGLAANTFEISATLGGAAVNTSGTQSGTHTAQTGDFISGDYPVYPDINFFCPGIPGTGNALQYAAWLVKGGTTGDPYTSCNLRWPIPATNPTTMFFNGNVVCGCHAGIYIGLPITFTGALSAGATSATLNAAWTGTSGAYPVIFNHSTQTGETEYQSVTFTNGSTGVSWSTGIAAASTTAANIGVSNANMATIAFGTGFGVVAAQGSNSGCKANMYFFGEYPAVEKTTFNTWNPTVSIASPAVMTLPSHGFAANQQFIVTTSGAVPTGMAVATTYFVLATGLTTNTFQFSLSAGGAAINTSGIQSGTHALSTGVGSQGSFTTTDTTGWPIGATLKRGIYNLAGGTDQATYTITSISGKNVTVTPNFSASHSFAGAGVFRTNGYGVQIKAITAPANISMSGGFSNIQLTGVQVNGVSFAQGGGLVLAGFVSFLCAGENPTNRTGFYFNHCSTSGSGSPLFAPSGAGISTLLYFNSVSGNASTLFTPCTQTTIFPGIGGISIKNCYVSAAQPGTSDVITSHINMPFIVNGLTLDNPFASICGLRVETANASLSNISINYGINVVGSSASVGMILHNALNISNTSNISINGMAKGVVLGEASSNVILPSFTFGNITPNLFDFGTELLKGLGTSVSVFGDMQFDSPVGLVNVYSTYFSSLLLGSSIRINNKILVCSMTIASPGVVTLANHGFAVNQPVVFITTGALPTGLTAGTTYYVSSVTTNTFQVTATIGGSAINTTGSQSGGHSVTSTQDNTVYTPNGITARDNGTFRNGASAIKINTLYTTVNTYTFTFPAASGVTYAIPLNMQYDTNYNSGLTIQPKVVATQGTNTLATVTSTAAALNAWERQTLSVSQSTGLTQTITLTFSCQSSNASGNAWIDGLVALPLVTSTRFYGYLENLTSLTKTADPVTVLSETAALALSGLAYNFGTSTLTISGAVTLSNIYDYLKAQLAAAANQTQASVITSTDGINFTGTFNATMTSAAVLTGTGTLNIGSNTLTVAAGATWGTTTVIQSTGRTLSTVTLTGLLAGSSVGFYNGSNALLTFTASTGTTASQAFLSDVPTIRYIVRKSGYVGIDTTISGAAGVSSLPTPQTFVQTVIDGTVSAYTGIAITSSLITLTTSHTLTEIYGYAQWNSHQSSAAMLLPIPVTTGDGVNFASPLSFTIGATGAVTGSGVLNIGSGTITLTAGGSSIPEIISAAQTLTSVNLSGIVSGSVVQVYNTTDSVEIYKGVPGTTLFANAFWTTNKALRIRVRYTTGATGYAMYESTATLAQAGVSVSINQVADSVYNANAIDGSSVTEFSLSGSTIKIFVNDSDNLTTAQRMYNWYVAALSTSTYIGLQPDEITAQTTSIYQFADAIQILNQKSATLFISGANINNVSGNGQVVDTSGGSIVINGYFPSDVATALGNHPIEGSYTFDQIMRGMSAVLMGKASGGPTNPVFRDLNDTTNRVSGIADSSGNRTGSTLNL